MTILRWFSQPQAHGGTRYRLYVCETGKPWAETPYFIDKAPRRAHYTMGRRYGLFGAGMGDTIHLATEPYRIARTFGGFDTLRAAKEAGIGLYHQGETPKEAAPCAF